MQDIAELIGKDRIAHVVKVFYSRVRAHPSLGIPFARVHDWPEHEAVLTHFWWVTLGGKRYLDYPYAVARKHMEAGFTPELLVDWLALFRETVAAEVPAEMAAGWLERAERIGVSLTYMHEAAAKGETPRSLLYRPA